MNNLDMFNLAMKQKLEGLIIDGKRVPVIYTNPEGEFHVKEKPSIVIMRSGMTVDTSRWSNDINKRVTSVDINGNPLTGVYYEYSHPYNLFYTIRAYGEYQKDMTEMVMHILGRLPRITYIVVDKLEYDVFYEQEFGKIVTNTEGTEDRGFVEQHMYKVEAVLDIGNTSKEYKYTQSKPTINIKSKEE